METRPMYVSLSVKRKPPSFPIRTESSPGWQRRRHRTPVSRGSPLRHVAALSAPILGKRLMTASESKWDLVSLNHQP